MRPWLTGWFVVLACAWGAVVASEPLFRALVHDLRAVVVKTDGSCGEALCLTVDRVIRRDVDLVWWVSVHKADTGGQHYVTPAAGPSPYTRAAYEANPVIRRGASWWLGGHHRVAAAALEPGARYYLRTCHAFAPLLWPRACTDSNVFTVEGKE